MLIRSFAILAAAASVAAAGHAVAQPYASYEPGSSLDELVVTGRAAPGVEIRARRVSYADLDIDGYAGARTLLGRIRGAAEQVCSPEPSTPADLRDGADYRDCLDDALDRAVSDVSAPAVSDLYHEAAWRYR